MRNTINLLCCNISTCLAVDTIPYICRKEIDTKNNGIIECKMNLLQFLFRILSFLYPYKLHFKLHSVRDVVYSLWIKNFVGHVGRHTKICYPCSLQGGGYKNIMIGNDTVIWANSILGCWVKYNLQDFPNASISIGNHCNIGEYNHITAINKITIGDGLLTGRYVIISDNGKQIIVERGKKAAVIINLDEQAATVTIPVTVENGKYRDFVTQKVLQIKKGVLNATLDPMTAYILSK